jgi:nitrite reductase (NADH) small subunit
MKLDDIPIGEGRALAVGDEQIAVFRLRDGTLRALGAVCPHLGGPLADGLMDGQVVICPLHGYTYDLNTGEETASGGDPVRAYTVTLDADREVVVEAAATNLALPCQTSLSR